jgi:hypothetical protein
MAYLCQPRMPFDADLVRPRPGSAPPRTNHGQMIKKPDRLLGDQASDLVAGAGFEPATSGL